MASADDLLPVEEPRLELYLFVGSEDDACWYTTNHRFVERPDIGTVTALMDEARHHFTELYPGIEAGDFSVVISYLDEGRSNGRGRGKG
jgi:hypothetical protein